MGRVWGRVWVSLDEDEDRRRRTIVRISDEMDFPEMGDYSLVR